MMLSALNCRLTTTFIMGWVEGSGVAASSPRLCREAFLSGHLTPLIGLRDRSRSCSCSIARLLQIWKLARADLESQTREPGRRGQATEAFDDRFDAWPMSLLCPAVCQGGGCRGVIDIGLESVVVDRSWRVLCRLRRTRES